MHTLALEAQIDAAGRLKLDVPTPLSQGRVDVVLVVTPQTHPRGGFDDLVGKLKWKGDAVREQRRIRDEW